MTSLYTRGSIARVLAVVRLLKTGRHNERSIALALECSTKTVQRDLELLRDRCGLPATYDASTRRWQVPQHWRFELR